MRIAVTRNSTPRVVMPSNVGAEKRHGLGEIEGLAATKVSLNSAASHVIHLRCDYFFTNLLMNLDSIRSCALRTVLSLDFPLARVVKLPRRPSSAPLGTVDESSPYTARKTSHGAKSQQCSAQTTQQTSDRQTRGR